MHGIALVPELSRGFTTNGGENKVSIIDLKTLATISKVETGGNPDAVLYEPSRKEIYTFNGAEKGGFNATVIDAAKGTVVATIPLGDKPETGQADPAAGRVFVNLEDKNLVGVIDIATHQKVAEWPLAPVTAPTGMAIDRQSKRLYVGGGKFLAVVDYASGKVVTSVPICTGTDATWIDDRLTADFQLMQRRQHHHQPHRRSRQGDGGGDFAHRPRRTDDDAGSGHASPVYSGAEFCAHRSGRTGGYPAGGDPRFIPRVGVRDEKIAGSLSASASRTTPTATCGTDRHRSRRWHGSCSHPSDC